MRSSHEWTALSRPIALRPTTRRDSPSHEPLGGARLVDFQPAITLPVIVNSTGRNDGAADLVADQRCPDAATGITAYLKNGGTLARAGDRGA
jgi:hypothetical protein